MKMCDAKPEPKDVVYGRSVVVEDVYTSVNLMVSV